MPVADHYWYYPDEHSVFEERRLGDDSERTFNCVEKLISGTCRTRIFENGDQWYEIKRLPLCKK